ncbi:hypothetical protein EON64_07630 [archaeon]|nr:MAG: hypothetical protein EON64_07630 [archaeon]
MQSSESKLQQITELAEKSRGNVVTLDDSTFAYFAQHKPRSYSLVVFLTAAHPKFKCGVCRTLDQELQLLASSYMKQAQARREEPRIFFVRLDYEASQKTFAAYDAASVPVVFYIAPSSGLGGTGGVDGSPPSARDRYQVPPDPSAEGLAGFVRDRAGVAVDIQRSKLLAYVFIVVAFSLLALLVRPLISFMPRILRLLRNSALWAVVSLGVYTCAISGLIFDIIRTPPLYHVNGQTGQLLFFYPHSGSQFVAEGFVIGGLNVLCALSLILASGVALRLKDAQHRTAAVLACLLVFIVSFRSVRALYVMKNNWYGARF